MTTALTVLPRDAMHGADYAIARCPSVRPSVCTSQAVFCQNGYAYP